MVDILCGSLQGLLEESLSLAKTSGRLVAVLAHESRFTEGLHEDLPLEQFLRRQGRCQANQVSLVGH